MLPYTLIEDEALEAQRTYSSREFRRPRWVDVPAAVTVIAVAPTMIGDVRRGFHEAPAVLVFSVAFPIAYLASSSAPMPTSGQSFYVVPRAALEPGELGRITSYVSDIGDGG